MSVNHVFLVGRVGAAPERRTTPTGKQLCTLRVPTDRFDRGQGGKVSDWHSVVVWDKEAETCARFLTAGSQVAVEGRISQRPYADKDGQQRLWTEVVAHRVTFLGGRGERGGEGAPAAASARDDIPF